MGGEGDRNAPPGTAGQGLRNFWKMLVAKYPVRAEVFSDFREAQLFAALAPSAGRAGTGINDDRAVFDQLLAQQGGDRERCASRIAARVGNQRCATNVRSEQLRQSIRSAGESLGRRMNEVVEARVFRSILQPESSR